MDTCVIIIARPQQYGRSIYSNVLVSLIGHLTDEKSDPIQYKDIESGYFLEHIHADTP